MGYSIRLEGDVRRLMARMKQFSELDKRQVTASMAEAMRTSTLDRFRNEKAPNGQRWKRSIRASTEGGKTLTNTARMKNSIHSQSDASGFAVGTNAKHAATHQFGEPGRTIRARRKKVLRFQYNGKWVSKKQVCVKIPARPFLGLSDEDMQEMKATVEDFIGREG